MNELISIVIPTYKRTIKYLSRAVDSVLSQTYENIELIVVNDNPCDASEKYEVDNYMSGIISDRVIYIQNKENLGGAVSRNIGAEKAHGSYISFLDDDDEYLPEKIQNQIEFMREKQCDLSFSNMKMYNNKGVVVDYREYSDIWSFENNELLKYHLIRHMTGTPTYMFRIDKFREIGGFDDVPIMQEYMLMLKCINDGLSIRYLDRCDVKIYKLAEGGITQGKRKIDAENRLYKMKKTYYPILTKKQIQMIKFRHWAVMTVAYKRNKQYYLMPITIIIAFFSAPLVFGAEMHRFVTSVHIINSEKRNLD